MALLGGPSEWREVEAGSEEDALFRSWKPMVEEYTNSDGFTTFEPMGYTQQVVAGMNYEVKFSVG